MSSSVPSSGPSSDPSSGSHPELPAGLPEGFRPRVSPSCGRVALGHDLDVEWALGRDHPTSAAALPIDELHREIGTRLVVVAEGTPRVVFTHIPERVVEEWERCQREGLVATHNLASSCLRFPQPEIRSTVVLGVSAEPVRCVLADAANAEAFALLAASLTPSPDATGAAAGDDADDDTSPGEGRGRKGGPRGERPRD